MSAPMTAWTSSDASASDHYLLLADISGYTSFMSGVEVAHGVDFSGGIPAGYSVLGALLDAVVDGVQPDFEVAKLEGDAVFAVAPAGALDAHGEAVLGYGATSESRRGSASGRGYGMPEGSCSLPATVGLSIRGT